MVVGFEFLKNDFAFSIPRVSDSAGHSADSIPERMKRKSWAEQKTIDIQKDVFP
jgi:hypothetical protein